MVLIFPLLFVLITLILYFLPVAIYRFIRQSPRIFTALEWRCFKGVMILFLVCLMELIILSKLDQRHVAKVEQLEQLKNKNRYFTLQKDTAYGEIILPKGSHVAKYMVGGLAPVLPQDLDDLEEIRFPDPIQILGARVIAISPKYGKMKLTEDFNYVSSLGEQEVCQKGQVLYYFVYSDDNLPQDYQPSQWSFSGCEASEYGLNPPFWRGDRLYSPIQQKYIQ